jgi:hypothetical protein
MDVRRWVAAGLCVPLLAVAGCSDDESRADPGDPSSSAVPTPSPSESEAAPSIPPEAMGTDEASAKAFVRHWFNVFTHSMNEGKVDEIKALSASGCMTCASFADLISRTYNSGGRIESDGWTAVNFARLDDESMAFDFIARSGMETFFRADGSVKRRYKGGDQAMTATLVQVDSAWKVKKLAVLDD